MDNIKVDYYNHVGQWELDTPRAQVNTRWTKHRVQSPSLARPLPLTVPPRPNLKKN